MTTNNRTEPGVCPRCGDTRLIPIGDGYSVNPCPNCTGPQPAGGGEKSGEFAPAPPDKTYQHALVRRLWEAQLGDLPDDVKRLMAEAATEIEGNLQESGT